MTSFSNRLNLKIRSYTSYFFIIRLYEIQFVRSKDNGTDSDTSAQPCYQLRMCLHSQRSRITTMSLPRSLVSQNPQSKVARDSVCQLPAGPYSLLLCGLRHTILMANVSIHSFGNGSKPPVRYRAQIVDNRTVTVTVCFSLTDKVRPGLG